MAPVGNSTTMAMAPSTPWITRTRAASSKSKPGPAKPENPGPESGSDPEPNPEPDPEPDAEADAPDADPDALLNRLPLAKPPSPWARAAGAEATPISQPVSSRQQVTNIRRQVDMYLPKTAIKALPT